MTDLLREDEANMVPDAVAAVTPLLVGDADRLRLALDVITSFDLFETFPVLLRLLAETRYGQIALAAASLATNPGVAPRAAALIRDVANRAEVSPAEARAIAIRLAPEEAASTELETLLKAQSWPGLSSNGERPPTAPHVLIDELAGPADFRWRLAGDLYEAGAAVRRLPRAWTHKPSPASFGTSVVVVTWTNAAVSRIREADPRLTVAQVIIAPSFESPAARLRVLAQAAQTPGMAGALRLPSPTESEAARDPLQPDVYKLGAFDTRDMLFLAGVSRHVMQRVREDLRPRIVRGTPYWSFNQLVGLRTWQYFQGKSETRRFSTAALKALVMFAGAPQPTRVGLTSTGEVLVESDGHYVNWSSGQEAMTPFVLLDEVFRPVQLGEGRVPSLPDPSRFTNVHPAVLGGTPRVVGFRITARAVAELVERHPTFVVQQAYPGLTEVQVADAAQLGGELLHAA